jgi:hypothetical protein
MKKLLLLMVVAATLMVPGRLNANSITPSAPTITQDGATWLYDYVLTLSSNAIAVSADTYCPGCDLPVTGSAMFQFFDFWGAIDIGDGLGDGSSGLFGDFIDVDTSGLVSEVGGTWASVISTFGLLELDANCEIANNVPCPSNDGGPEVLIAYASGDPIGDGTGEVVLGHIVVRSIYGPTLVSPANRETFISQDCVPALSSTPNDDDPDADPCSGHPDDVDFATQTNAGPYRPPDPVPEPTTMLLLGTGLLGIGSRLRKKNKKDKGAATV